MKKPSKTPAGKSDRDTMRPEYDFSTGTRGVTSGRYRDGTNVVVIDPEVLDVFPNADAINEALRALAPVLRKRRGRRPPNKPMQRTAGGSSRR